MPPELDGRNFFGRRSIDDAIAQLEKVVNVGVRNASEHPLTITLTATLSDWKQHASPPGSTGPSAI